ncbi:IDEAL domain-containing protein [Bacillus licheniformis]|uniref:IDEAL domain-containing protein n=1 Tax=Bacillus licheniformis TaxID=1402 RepID=UPI002DB884E9|nr:IDEAL domain-containing protein [Bacillus licheniformis]MEC1863160.1 IDEAL domain-containing protein [Bacillus licheniformis]
MTRLNVGDWVTFISNSIITSNGLIIKQEIKGYIDAIDGNHAKVKGIDGTTYIGEKIEELTLCEDTPKYTQESLRTMINIALDTKDRNWFEELTSELRRIQEVEG